MQLADRGPGLYPVIYGTTNAKFTHTELFYLTLSHLWLSLLKGPFLPLIYVTMSAFIMNKEISTHAVMLVGLVKTQLGLLKM